MRPPEFYSTPLPAVLPAGLSVRWLGTAGFVFTYAGTVLAIDPYLSRVPLWRYLTGPLKVDEASVRAALPHADCIVVGHSHFDHVMDVPSLALATGALVVGSSSTANLMRVSGVPEAQIVECVSRHTFEVGPFRVELVPSVHSEFALGHRVPYAGEIPCSCEFRGRGKDYRCGQVFGVHITVAGCTFYHLGSANLIDDEIRFRPVDVFLMGISGRHATDRFIPRVLKKVEPRVVVPMHHDNFFRPADAPLSLLPLTRFGRFVDETFAFHKDITVRALPIGGVLSPNSATVEAQP